ncbi:Do family serine endopeptidase [Saccharophagus degradans]|uniref:Probable periplasmic serine endoprotease DegP-like n=1 Tax=Saccharophagus degradans TaxID=86304 RepID=A0AAW7X307_9GAMM|nr:Do family serine endopeptidase [Saccharophagus degradans]MDO6420942.1 Do family serine endopeptidase [Saccharophagus degradans]MDO6606147.1 Do family serine endopeptidase [Saccharophagus degradans]
MVRISSWLLVFCVLTFTGVANANLPDFTDLIERSSPAVVKINTSANVAQGRLQLPQGQQVPEWFKHFLDPGRQGIRPNQRVQSMGSGFFISADGYVITNHHVIDNADEITVELVDRREYPATVVGVDSRSDLALLKIDEDNLPFLKVAEGSPLKVGEWVVAIGSPFGLKFSASAGIVSAIGRSIRNQSGEDYVPFVQTDVAINPGNSGGPLFNLKGEVVGVNSQIYSQSGGSIGLSFAIPSSVVNNVVKQLKEKGTVSRGWLGVVIQEVDADLAASFGLDRPRGALVSEVLEDSPAEKGGLQPGDVIVSFDGGEILTSSDLPHLVGATQPETKVDVEVVRKGKTKKLKVEVGALPGADAVATLGGGAGAAKGGVLGVQVADAPKDLLEQLKLDGGVLVQAVAPNSPASNAGIKAGDVISEVNFIEVKSVKSLQKVAKELPKGKLLPIRFFSDGRPVFRTIKIAE